MARVFSWIIETEGKTGYTYITNAENREPIVQDYRFSEESTDFKKIYRNANSLTEEKYAELFAKMQKMANEEFGYKDEENIIEGDYSDYFGENENYILLAGTNGKDGNGKDGVSVVFRYHLYKNEDDFKSIDNFPDGLSNAQINERIENGIGWSDSPQGISQENTIEVATEKRLDDSNTGITYWSRPVIWSKWGQDGKDGEKGKDGQDGKDGKDGNRIEYVFCRTIDDLHKPDGYYTDAACTTQDFTGETYQTDEFCPWSKIDGNYIRWDDDPVSSDQDYRTVWCAIRRKEKESNIWAEFSEPVIWSRYAKDGIDGKDGADGKDGVNGSGINVYLTNQSVDVFPNEDGTLNYDKANSEIVVMNGTTEISNDDSLVLSFRGFDTADNGQTYTDGNITFRLEKNETTPVRKKITIEKILQKGRFYIPVSVNYQGLADATSMDVELDYDGRIEVSFNTNSYRYEDSSKDTPINNSETIKLNAAFYNGFTVNNTRWEIIDESGAWTYVSSGVTEIDIPYNSDLWKNRNEIFVRCYGEIKNDDGAVIEKDYDIVSLFKFYDGKNGKDGKDGQNGKDGVNADGLTMVLSNPVAEVYPELGIDGKEHINYTDAKTDVKLFTGSNVISGDTEFKISLLNDTGWQTTDEGATYSNDFAIVSIDNAKHTVELTKAIKPWSNLLSVPIMAEYNGSKAVFAWIIEYDADGNRIEISSDANTFLEKDSKYDRDEIKFTSKFTGCFSSANTKWQTGNNGIWVNRTENTGITEDKNGTTFILSRVSDMADISSLRVRCFGQLETNTGITDYDEITVFKLREGTNGKNGVDGSFIEFIYKCTTGFTEEDKTHWPNTWDVNDNDDYLGPVEYGWSDNPSGISPSVKYEYISKREKKNGTWSKFSEPTVWAAWGEKGSDGQSVEYVYFLTSDGTVPSIDTYNINSDDYQKDGYLPLSNGESWSDEPQTLVENKGFQWVAIRKYKNGKWDVFSNPTLWNRLARDGAKGETGAIYRYKGEWNSGNTYVSNTEFIDYVSYGTGGTVTEPMLQYYALKTGCEGTGLALGGAPDNNTNWTKFFVAESIATNFLLTDQIKANIISATTATIEKVSADTLNAAYAKIGEISAETLDAAYAKIETVSADTLDAAKAEIEKLSANTVNANEILAQNIEANKASIDELKTRSITANEIHAVKENEDEGIRQGADIDATKFFLFYSSTTVDSRIYLQIMPEYTIPSDADSTDDYFTSGTVLKNVPVLVMEYATKHGQIKRFLDPFISWKPYEKIATESWTWYPITAYTKRDGLSLGGQVSNLYLVESSNGNFVGDSSNKVLFFTHDGTPKSTDKPTDVYTNGSIYIPYAKNSSIATYWKQLFGQELDTYAWKNLATESWAVPGSGKYISVGTGENYMQDPQSGADKIFDSSSCPFAAYKVNFVKYNTASDGKITISKDNAEYYFSQVAYTNTYNSTRMTYVMKTNLTGDTLSSNYDKFLASGTWTASTIDATIMESDYNTAISYNQNSLPSSTIIDYAVDIVGEDDRRPVNIKDGGIFWDKTGNSTFLFDCQ